MKSKDSNTKKSVSYQKKDGRGHAHPLFFWYDSDKDLRSVFSNIMKSTEGCQLKIGKMTNV